MKKIRLLQLLIILTIPMFSQNMNGFVENNYSGVVGNRFNPANIADNKLHLDISVLSTNINVAGDNISYNLDKSEMSYGDNGKINANLALDFDIGLMVSFGKFGLGFSARPKTFITGTEVDPNLVRYLVGDENASDNFTLKNDETNILANAWNEYAFNFGMVVMDKGDHFIKAGAEIKLMQGLGGVTFKAHNLNLEYDDNNDITNIEGANGGASILYSSNLEAGGMELPTFKNVGKFSLGYSFGAVYEWRPDSGSEKEDNGYKVKVGLSILDIGKLKYTSAMYSTSFTFPEANFDTSDLEGDGDLEMEELYNSVYDGSNKYFEGVEVEEKMEITLPTKLNLYVDYNISGNWYVALINSISLKNSNKTFSLSEYSYFSVNPRYETKYLGFGMPISYRSIDGFHYGASASLGFFYIGTSDIGAFVNTDNIDSGNLYLGFRIPI